MFIVASLLIWSSGRLVVWSSGTLAEGWRTVIEAVDVAPDDEDVPTPGRSES
ncbi:MAG: hypothetical protein ABSD78_02365 [Acidimicrobiales bacterium]|jgi:hypothetical protein